MPLLPTQQNKVGPLPPPKKQGILTSLLKKTTGGLNRVSGYLENPNTMGGFARNTLTAIPKQTGVMAKDIVQGTARNLASAGMTLTGQIGQLDTNNKAGRILYGNEPVKDIATRVVDSEQRIKQSPLAQRYGADRFATPLAFTGVMGSVALDSTYGGGARKSVIKQIAKSTDEKAIAGLLKKVNVADDLIEGYSKKLATIKDEKQVATALKSAEKLQKTSKVSPKIHDEDLNEMRDFVDYAHGAYRPKNAIQSEIDARRIAEKYKIANPDVPNKVLANKFGPVLDTQLKPKLRKEDRFIKSPTGKFVGSQPKPYKGETDLTTKVLEKLKGRSTVSKQFISDLTNSPDLKQAERDLLRRSLESEGDTINVPNFAKKVKTELLPLSRNSQKEIQYSKRGERVDRYDLRYENISLPDDIRGNVANYDEHIYESPVPTSAGKVHFGSDNINNYFGHTRVEDLAPARLDKSGYNPKGATVGDTRRVIEVQSDLYQKGRLESEANLSNDPMESDAYEVMQRMGRGEKVSASDKEIMLEDSARRATAREKELSKLRQYNDPTAHFRMIREEIKQAAIDGKTKLQFPTGETAMKIEGLGSENNWYNASPRHSDAGNITGYAAVGKLTPDSLEAGKVIKQAFSGDEWVITDVLGDGKFKAVSKEVWDNTKGGTQPYQRAGFGSAGHFENVKESFDISGKVDTNNPIYKFYEKDIGRYLNKYGVKKVVDAQGVSWFEISIDKSMAKAPIEAFGVAGGLEAERDEEGNITGLGFSPIKAAMGVAGFTAFNRGKKFFTKQETDNIRVQLNVVREALENHPARALAKYANKNGELPEVLGRSAGKFQNSGDDIVTQLGFPDSETARRSYEDYLLGKKRVTELEESYKVARESMEPKEKKALLQKLEGIKIRKDANEFVDAQMAKRITTPQVSDMKSLAEIAEQSRQAVVERGSRTVKPLLNMVEEMQTPVKKKINALDYLRTPDRVLRKIGLGKIADMVRVQYDKYVQELPKNIEIITEWSKRVPAESNKRIFKWLDGQSIILNENEMKVAGEIRTYLDIWAERLALPKSKRLSNYITHIFDDQLIKKEFDEDLAKIISDKVPGSVYDPFLQQRLGAMGYIEDTWKALDAYTKRATRKVHMDPALAKLEEAASGLEETQWKYVKRYADRINLRPTELDTHLDNLVKSIPGVEYKLGQRPVATISRNARQMVYRGLLGLNVSSALKNLSQGANTYAKLGEKYTALGYMKLITNFNSEELVREGVLNNGFIQDRALNATKKFWEKADKGLFFLFEGAERINRGAAYFGAKAKGLSQGMNEREAITYAKKIVRDTQFSFGSVDTPVLFQSDIVKTLGQFQSYSIKQGEFLAEMAKNKEFAGLARYSLAGLAFVFTLGKMFGMEPKDLVPFFRFDTPPTLEAPWEATKAVADAPDEYGNDRTIGEKVSAVGSAAALYIPGYLQGKKTVQGLRSYAQGKVTRKDGDKLYDVAQSKSNLARSAVFGKYSTPEARAYYDDKDTKSEFEQAVASVTTARKEENNRIRPIYDQAQKLKEQGQEAEAQALVEQLSDEDYAIYKRIRTAEKAKATREGEERIYPLYKQVQQLKEAGRMDEAQAIVDGLSDEDYRLYKLLKDRLSGN